MTKTETLISVILPVYNGADVVGEAIESVLGQTLQAFETIIVDDASTDDSAAVVKGYLRKDSRLRFVQNPSRSRGGTVEWDSRNDGLRLARGEYVAYLDGDNTWRPQFLETLAEVLLENPRIQFTHCDSCNHYPPGLAREVVERDQRDLLESGPEWTVFSYSRFEPQRLGKGIYVDANEIMHRRSVFQTLGGFWRTEHPRREEINALQVPRRPYRRHADLDLLERIISAFGVESVHQVQRTLVDFYYPGSRRGGPRPDTPRSGPSPR